MFQLTREVRFAIPLDAHQSMPVSRGGNGHGGVPAMDGLSIFLILRVTLAGELEPASSYLRNIKDIDRDVRTIALPIIQRAVGDRSFMPARLMPELFRALSVFESGVSLIKLEWVTSPFQSFTICSPEADVVKLSQKFEFSAAHRLHNPSLDAEQNVATFGKCNNVHGHGHNYEVQVTLAGTPDANGRLIGMNEFEKIVDVQAITKLDHKHLNIEVEAFKELNPSVENIAKVIYGWLKSPLHGHQHSLAAVTVWETPKTWCEYSE